MIKRVSAIFLILLIPILLSTEYIKVNKKIININYTGYGIGLLTDINDNGFFEVWLDKNYEGKFSLCVTDYYSGGYKPREIKKVPIYFPSNNGNHKIVIKFTKDKPTFNTDVIKIRNEPIKNRLVGFGDSFTFGNASTKIGETDYLSCLSVPKYVK